MSKDEVPIPPLAIIFMLVCHAYADPGYQLGQAHWNSPSGQKWRTWLMAHDLIDMDHKSTERGKAWVDFICATPLPEQCWKLPKRATS
jgi:hypothetical protein